MEQIVSVSTENKEMIEYASNCLNYINSLSDKDAGILKYYKSNTGHKYINSYLRYEVMVSADFSDDFSDDYQTHIARFFTSFNLVTIIDCSQTIKQIIKNGPKLPCDIKVYRGTSEHDHAKTLSGIISASLDENIAIFYGIQDNIKRPKPFVSTINISKNIPCLFLNSPEREIIFFGNYKSKNGFTTKFSDISEYLNIFEKEGIDISQTKKIIKLKCNTFDIGDK